MKAVVYTSSGEKKGEEKLQDSVFGLENINTGLIHRYLLFQRNNGRIAIAHTKTRSERVGSTRKIYRQKGTGRARMGSNRSPVRRKGGVVFGPRSNQNWQEDMNRKERRLALKSMLSLKAQNKEIAIVEKVDFEKTKNVADFKKAITEKKLLLIHAGAESSISQYTNNCVDIKTLLASYVNPADVLKYEQVLFTQDGLKEFESIFNK